MRRFGGTPFVNFRATRFPRAPGGTLSGPCPAMHRWCSGASHGDVDLTALQRNVRRLHRKTLTSLQELSKHPEECGHAAAPPLDQQQRLLEDIVNLQAVLADARPGDTAVKDCICVARKLGVPLPTRSQPKTAVLSSCRSRKMQARRKPYINYVSSDDIVIRVGRSAEDNDQLSINNSYRCDDDWWLHVSGHSGSHVVVCNQDDNLPERFPNTLRQAAFLAAKHSKCPDAKVSVSYTRCKFVSKLDSDPPGLVRLVGAYVDTIVLSPRHMTSYMESIMKTKHF